MDSADRGDDGSVLRRAVLKGAVVLMALVSGCSAWFNDDRSETVAPNARSTRSCNCDRVNAGRINGTRHVAPADGGDGIQRAIDEVREEGGRIILHDGTYELDSPLTLYSNVELVGNQSVLKATSNMPVVVTTPTGNPTDFVKIDSVEIDTNGNAPMAIQLHGVNHSVFRDIVVAPVPEVGMAILGSRDLGSAFNTLENVWINAHRPLYLEGYENGSGLVSTITIINSQLKVSGKGGVGCYLKGAVAELTFVGGDISTADRAPAQEGIRAETSAKNHVIHEINVYNTHVEFETGVGTYVFRSKMDGGTQRDFNFVPGNLVADRNELGDLDTYTYLTGGGLNASGDVRTTKYLGKGLVVRDNSTGDKYRIRVNNGNVEAEGPI